MQAFLYRLPYTGGMKKSFLSVLKDAAVNSYKRLFGRDTPVEIKAVAPVAPPSQAAQAFDHVKQLGTLGNNPEQFSRQAGELLQSESGSRFSGDVAKATAQALQANPDSDQLYKTLIASHKALGKQTSKHLHDAEGAADTAEKSHLHQQAIASARTMINTGAKGELRDHAFRDMAQSVDALLVTDPQAARRVISEISRDKDMAEGLKKAAQATAHHQPATHKHATHKPAEKHPSAPAKASGLEDHNDIRMRNLGVHTSPRPPAVAVEEIHDPEITRQIIESTKPAQLHIPARVEVQAAQEAREAAGKLATPVGPTITFNERMKPQKPGIEGLEVSEINIDFDAAVRAFGEDISAAAKRAAPSVRPAVLKQE